MIQWEELGQLLLETARRKQEWPSGRLNQKIILFKKIHESVKRLMRLELWFKLWCSSTWRILSNWREHPFWEPSEKHDRGDLIAKNLNFKARGDRFVSEKPDFRVWSKQQWWKVLNLNLRYFYVTSVSWVIRLLHLRGKKLHLSLHYIYLIALV